MSKHTPGPWFVTEGGQYIEASRYEHGGRQIVGKPQGDNPEQWNANARLIAAAPELLEALQSVVAWMDAPDESAFSDTQLDCVRAAIAKATGEKK